ncbi:alpha/beta fold hydrolase [Catenuloplanes japonicus]|uniref:alpha/beta fold hydrolase n=1 Tax=Catenuloplanes japonicus TaxID=33876 RepID=UPI000526253B|nr:alpha/beta hydrolase family protein [Catenuloplanes japonicus]
MATYVLVHGAWHSGEVWDRVTPLLTAAGHRVFAPSLTGHGPTRDRMTPEVGLETYVGDIVTLLRAEDLHDVILVGHSYAGMVISGAAGAVPERIGRLVYLDAMVPVDGETAVDVMPEIAGMIEASGSWRVPPFPLEFLGVTAPEDVAWVSGMLTDEPALCYRQPVRMAGPAVAAVPRTHIHCVGESRDVTRRPVDGEVWTLASGHDCMVTVPGALADLLLKLG